MGLFDRVSRIVRSNINSMVSAAEDPEKILNQTINDMQEDLIQLRQAVATAIASQKRMERQHDQSQQQVDEWERRAKLAIQNNDDDLARQALVRKKGYAETAQSLKRQLDDQTQQVQILRTNMTKLESKISEAKTKKDMLIARARSAKASQQISEVIGKVNTTSALSAFDRMEEKVNSLEAQSAAVAELSSDTLESKFAALESGGSDVDSELALLKASVNKENALPSGDQKALGKAEEMSDIPPSEVDDELEKLRSEIDNL
jgi:phage shock protein A